MDLIPKLTALLVVRRGRRRRSCGPGAWESAPKLGSSELAVAGALWIVLAAGAQPPIRIGTSVSQTGTYALLGQNQLRGYQLCVKHTNEKSGVLGRRLELVVEDDRSEPATTARLYEKLINQNKVDAVLGPYSSPVTDAVADVTEKYRMAMVAPGPHGPRFISRG